MSTNNRCWTGLGLSDACICMHFAPAPVRPPHPVRPARPPPSHHILRVQVQVSLTATCLAPSGGVPVAQLAYSVPSTGQVLSRSLELPLVVTKFCQAVEVPPAVFAQRWQQVAGPPFKLARRLSPVAPQRAAVETLLTALHFRLLPGADGDAATVCAACVLHCGGSGGAAPRQVPCMIKVEGCGTTAAGVAVATADAQATDALCQRLAALLAEL